MPSLNGQNDDRDGMPLIYMVLIPLDFLPLNNPAKPDVEVCYPLHIVAGDVKGEEYKGEILLYSHV